MLTLRVRSGKYLSAYSRSFAVALVWIALGYAFAFAQPDNVTTSFAAVAKAAGPAVVSIDAKGRSAFPVARTSPDSRRTPTQEEEDVNNFLRRQFQRPVNAVGSGFIVDKSGYIMTNRHVIAEAMRVTVRLSSGEEFLARVIGSDDETDLAVIKIDAGADLPFLRFGDSKKAEVGDWVLAIGSPFGLAKTVTAGIISQTQRDTPASTVFQRFIQTDAAINRGNSGGPLVNIKGEVIGINSQIATSTGDYNGVGFALPSAEAVRVYESLIKYGKVRRGFLGAFLDSVKPEFAKVYGLKEAKGAIITEISDDQGPAARATLKSGDIVVEFNGEKVEDAQDLISRVASTPPDQSVNLGILRENGTNLEAKTITARLGERQARIGNRESPAEDEQPGIVDANARPFGLSLVELSSTLAATHKLEGQTGIMVRAIDPDSYITDVRNANGVVMLSEGDLIQRINRMNITSLKSFNDIASKLKPGDPVVLHVTTYNPARRSMQLKIVQFTVK